jgi:hypothetical protein
MLITFSPSVEEVRDAATTLPKSIMWSTCLNALLGLTMIITVCYTWGYMDEIFHSPREGIRSFRSATKQRAATLGTASPSSLSSSLAAPPLTAPSSPSTSVVSLPCTSSLLATSSLRPSAGNHSPKQPAEASTMNWGALMCGLMVLSAMGYYLIVRGWVYNPLLEKVRRELHRQEMEGGEGGTLGDVVMR